MLDTRDISATDQQQLGVALAGRGSVNAPMPFAAGLAVEEVYGAFAWRDLPGLHSRSVFRVANWFAEVETENGAAFVNASFGSSHGGDCCFAVGSTGLRSFGSVALGETATGCHQSLLGSIFTTGTTLQIASDTEPLKVFTPTGLSGITKPCEINGFIFFTACVTAGVEVIGYLPPPLWIPDATFGNTEQTQRRIQHFSTEHIGTSARVGLWQGRIVVATTKGVWGIKGLGDGQGYGIDTQIESWNLSPETQFAITHDDIWALDNGVLMRRGQSTEIIGNCGFTVLGSDGRIAVLSEPGGRFAVSNGTDFEEFGGDNRALVIGTLLGRNGAVLSTDRVAWPIDTPAWLTTAWAVFPNSIAIESVQVDPAVMRVKLLTETASWDLQRSIVSPSIWRAGYSGTRLKIMIEVPADIAISPPILKLRRRTLV